MGMGQMMLTIGALLLLSTVLLRINTGNLNASANILENKVELLTIAYAESIMNDAIETAFDNNTTAPSLTLGKEKGEGPDEFDDFDDFISTNKIIDYRIEPDNPSTIRIKQNIKVVYVNPIFSSGTLKWEAAGSGIITNFKQMTITLEDPNSEENKKLFKNKYTYNLVMANVQ